MVGLEAIGLVVACPAAGGGTGTVSVQTQAGGLVSASNGMGIVAAASGTGGVDVDTGAVTLQGEPVDRNELGYVAPGPDRLELTATEDSRVLFLGGEPFGEQIVMWWNFIGRDHDEIVGYREEWQSLLETGSDERFAIATDDPREPLAAPPLPNARLRPRG